MMAGQSLSACALWMQDTTLPWLAYELSHSPVAVGWLAFCRYIPFAALSMSSGAAADRFDNRKMLIVLQIVATVTAAALAALTIADLLELWQLYAFAVLGGVTAVLDYPARNALTLQLVGPEQLSNAIALNASLVNAARIVGPAAAGVIIATVGAGVCFALNAAAYLPLIATLLVIRPARRVRSTGTTAFRAVREGLSYVRRTTEIRLLLLLTATITIVGFNFRVMLPVLSSHTLDAGPEVFGVLVGCFGVGSVLGAFVAASQVTASWRSLLVGAGSLSLITLAIAPLSSAGIIAVLLVGMGAAYTLWTSNSQSVLLLTGPKEMRGRLLALYLLAIAGVAPIGSVISGWLAGVGGTELAFLVAGGASLPMVLYTAYRMRHVRATARREAVVAEVPDAVL